MFDTLQLAVELPNNSGSQRLRKQMSDTLQLVVDVLNTQHYKNKSTFRVLNECPIRFSLSATLPSLNGVWIRESKDSQDYRNRLQEEIGPQVSLTLALNVRSGDNKAERSSDQVDRLFSTVRGSGWPPLKRRY